MPLHFSFTFGVGSYFNFSFGVGSPASKAAQTPKAKSSTELSIDPSKGRHIEPSSEPATTTTEHDHLIGKGLDTFVKFKDLQNIIGQDTLIPITRAAPKRVDGKKVILPTRIRIPLALPLPFVSLLQDTILHRAAYTTWTD